jgi:hypothetical protein
MPKLIGRDATTSLGVSLNTDNKSLNNTVKLLTILKPGHAEPDTRSAIIALERFFSERLCRGDLRAAAPAAAAAAAATAAAGAGTAADAAAAKYTAWFAKHYKLFTKRLCALLANPGTGPKAQVLALAAGAYTRPYLSST